MHYPTRPTWVGFHSISFPSEWGESKIDEDYGYLLAVSIQLVSPASGEESLLQLSIDTLEVSIQLVSPASGEVIMWGLMLQDHHCFHSISFPSEWGVVPSIVASLAFKSRFHSISFPSEWGVWKISLEHLTPVDVSIQLVSPASGELTILGSEKDTRRSFPFN